MRSCTAVTTAKSFFLFFSPYSRSPLLLILTLIIFCHTALADPNPILLSFLNENGDVIGLPQTISYAKCTPLDFSQLNSTDGFYTSITTTDLRSALNLYSNTDCQPLYGSTVGQWDNAAPVTNIVAIRWEGTANASIATGTVRSDPFPEALSNQTQAPDVESGLVWDPPRGKVLVSLVASILAIGIIVGAYQVYEASLYEAPQRKEKKDKKNKGLNTKKIKKKDAYFKKPAQRDQQTFRRMDSPAPSIADRPLISERRDFRNSQISDTASLVDWNQQRSMYNNGSDTIVINMQELSTTRPSQVSLDTSSLDLMCFESENSSSGNFGRGRGGEVLVPMHTFGNNGYQPR
ncbi:hypothetical protein BGZ46_002107 [Entomortierella lignicola]|nr:hypothetical protein BGZ46_002107 [Entomortierella lignicola]